jgi:hypothetical protein
MKKALETTLQGLSIRTYQRVDSAPKMLDGNLYNDAHSLRGVNNDRSWD